MSDHPARRFRGAPLRFWAIGLALPVSVAVAACGPAGAPVSPSETVQAASHEAEPWLRARPCTLLTPDEAADIGGAPYLRTMADNRVLGAVTSCSYAIGAGGMNGLVQVNVLLPAQDASPDAFFAARCADPAAPRVVEEAPYGRRCEAASGSVVALLDGAALEATVQGGMGEVDRARTQQLADLVGPRLSQARP